MGKEQIQPHAMMPRRPETLESPLALARFQSCQHHAKILALPYWIEGRVVELWRVAEAIVHGCAEQVHDLIAVRVDHGCAHASEQSVVFLRVRHAPRNLEGGPKKGIRLIAHPLGHLTGSAGDRGMVR